MNIKKGTFRLAIVLSILSVVLGVMILGSGGDEDVAATIAFCGPVLILICYLGFWFVIKGFKAQHCENCERNIGKLEESFNFKEYVVCAEP